MFPFFSRMFPGTNLQDLNLDWIIRRVMELSKGIIAPWINAQNQHWMVYDTAAETFVDSGVSAAGEGTGPQGEPGKSPIIGTNGNWYTWDTATQAYTDTGIPATGPTGPEGPEGLEGPQGPRGPGVNKNWLDNWDFVGGGSQQTDVPEALPINQQGLTSYPNEGKCIDRWVLARGSITLQTDGLLCTSPSNNSFRIDQKIPYGVVKNLLGKPCTVSALVNNTLCEFNISSVSETEQSKSFTVDGVRVDLKVNFATAWGNVSRPIQIFIETGKSATVKAIKLELGPEQTLAHNEGTNASPVWVLNEIPDYGQELAKCQRYYIKFNNNVFSGFSNSTGSYAYVSTGIIMASEPTISVQDTGTIIAKDGEGQVSNIIIWSTSKPSVGLRIAFATVNSSHADSVVSLAGSVFTLSCDL